MNPNDFDGVPLEGAAEGEYVSPVGAASNPTGASENTPALVAPKRSKFPLCLLGLIPLLALGGFAASRFLGGAPADVTEDPALSPKTSPRVAKAPAPDANTVGNMNAAMEVRGAPKGTAPQAATTRPATAQVPASSSTAMGAPPPNTSVAGSSALSGVTVQKVAGGELVGMRRTLEADGWTVHWLGKTREVRAWKALDAGRKRWTEVRVIPAATYATLMQKGPKGRVLSTQNQAMSLHARLVKGSVMAPSPFLQSATQGRFHLASDGKATLSPPSR